MRERAGLSQRDPCKALSGWRGAGASCMILQQSQSSLHRQVKYLNNVIEADHGKLKQLIRPVRGFKTLKTAYATIKGFEVMHALRKGQASAFNVTRDIRGEARIVERASGLGASALTEAAQFLNEQLQREAA